MKNLSFLWLLLVTQVLFAQALSYEDPMMEAYFADKSNLPIIRGKFLHFTPEDLDTLSVYYVVHHFSPDIRKDYLAKINQDGSFELKIEYPIPYQEIWFTVRHVGSVRLYAHKELFVEIDLQKWRELIKSQVEPDPNAFYKSSCFHWTGADAAMNRILDLYHSFDLERLEQAFRLEAVVANKNLNLTERLFQLHQAQDLFTSREDEFFQGQNKNYQWIASEERRARYYGYLIVAHFYPEKSQQPLPQKIFDHRPHLLNGYTLSYYTYLGYVLQHYSGDLYRGLDSVAFSPQKKDLIKLMGGSEELGYRMEHVQKVLPTMQASWCKQLLEAELQSKIKQTQQINQILGKLSLDATKKGIGKTIGSLPQGAQLYHAEETSVDSLIKRIRSQYPNQAIILDVWATWCGPCVDDMKNSKNNKEELKKESIQLLYLCANERSSEEKWRKKIVEIGVDGEHLWLNNELSAKLMGHFKLSGYPSYIFIDTKGKYRPHLVSSIQYLDVAELKKKL